MDSKELVAAAETLEADELADIAPDLPRGSSQDVVQALPPEERERLRAALSYPEGTVGALMDFDQVTVREDVTLEAVTRYLRRMDELPDHTDQLFVVDREQPPARARCRSPRLIVSDLELEVARGRWCPRACSSTREDPAEDAAQRLRALRPGLGAGGRSRRPADRPAHRRMRWWTTSARSSAESQLAEAGLREEEDVFAPVLDSFRNRWAWLAVNLVTAFIASRVIGAFEDSIAKLVALAALMPIVAGIGGNSGNQTITMIVRALALGQIQAPYWTKLLAKELGVALLNGVVWGTLLGADRLRVLRQRRARRRDGARDDPQPAARRRDGRRHSARCARASAATRRWAPRC